MSVLHVISKPGSFPQWDINEIDGGVFNGKQSQGKEILTVRGIASFKMITEEHARGLSVEIASCGKCDSSHL